MEAMLNFFQRGMAGRRPELPRDGDSKRIDNMNGYTMLMGYLSMAIKGLGFLVLTWTTVVLLGGFVSTLQKKDFWCLTFITLVQTAGVFDVVLNEKLGYIRNSVHGLIGTVMGLVTACQCLPNLCPPIAMCLSYVLLSVQLVVIVAVLCPLAIIYVFGILISGGISLWRLIEHDYSDGEAPNLEPAMNTLYYLALLQGVIFCYRFLSARIEKGLARKLAKGRGKDYSLEVFSNYLRETRKGCEVDPSFANGSNLITHAIDMIGSSSPADCIFGVEILYTAINFMEDDVPDFGKQHVLMKHLVLSASSSTHILKKLLETLDSRGLHDRGTRHKAAMIVDCLALNISLELFPQGIDHISSMIGTFDQYSIVQPFQQDRLYEIYEQHWKIAANKKVTRQSLSPAASNMVSSYKLLLLRGLSILRKLAADKTNCRIISDTPDLVSQIVAPVTFDLLDHTSRSHGAWYDIVEASMRVMVQFTGAPGKVGAKLRHQVASCEEAINTLWRILDCDGCNDKLQISAIQILADIYMDTESSRVVALKSECRSGEDFVKKLVDIFTQDNNKSISIRKKSGVALSEYCFRSGSCHATIAIQTGGGGGGYSLIQVLLHEENETCRQSAAEILEHLCTRYTKADEFLDFRKAMYNVMPKVIEQIIHYQDEKQEGEDEFAKPETDIESQTVVQSIKSATLLSSLLSLCRTVYNTFIGELGSDLDSQFHASSFLKKLTEIVLQQSEHPMIENLSVCKAIARMVIAMMKHSSRFAKQEHLQSLIQALSSASKKMLDVDYTMVFSSASSAITTMKLDRCTLVSLVKQAKELHAIALSTSASG